jgi:hypothetical protein
LTADLGCRLEKTVLATPAVIALPTVSVAQVVGLVLTAVAFAGSMAAMRWVCDRERRRRASLDVFSRSLQEELAESGYRALFASPVVLCLILVVLLREGGEVLPGLIAGGIAGLTASLGLPNRVVAFVRPDYLRKMDPARRRFHQEVTRRRQPALIVAVVAPLIFAAVVAYGRVEAGYAHDPRQAAAMGFILGTVQVGLLAWGVQYVQVLRSLQREAIARERVRTR